MTSSLSKNIRNSTSLLPTYFQTEKNKRFLSSTLDQLYKVPELDRINGFVGSKLTPTFNSQKDVYLSDADTGVPSLREKYEFTPALTIKDVIGNYKKSFGFDDLVNQLTYHGAHTDNLNNLFAPEVSSYDPHIDWDKFVNFRQYYWLPTGPETITVTGLQKNTVSTYTVTDSDDKNYFIFTPDGFTQNPLLTLYKDVTYVFNVNSDRKFFIKTTNNPGVIDALGPSNGITNNGTSNGQIIFSVGETLPGILYYCSDESGAVIGTILIRDIEENSSINVDDEIVGKATYTTAPRTGFPTGLTFVNGLRIRFAGEVTPSFYANKEFIVEGVGTAIRLVDYNDLKTPETFATEYDDDFDVEPFDDFPFDGFETLPITPDYITINRSGIDGNSWSRYNRWFHQNVIELSATANGTVPVYPLDSRAKRPIIEFDPDLQLYNFGNNYITSVTVIDNETSDAFSTIEYATSAVVDGVSLQPGMLVIFNVDSDPMVRGKVFEVSYSNVLGVQRINLAEIISPIFGNSVVVLDGTEGKGSEWFFNGETWIQAQARTSLNQAPLFDLFDELGRSYSDKTIYDSIFSGNKLFGYAVGSGVNDPVLGFPLSYKNVGVEGSYLFQNYFNTDKLSILGPNTVTEISTSETYLRVNAATGSYLENVWTPGVPYQLAVQQFQAVNASQTKVKITVYDKPATINDLSITVFVGDIKLKEDTDYSLTIDKTDLYVEFTNAFGEITNVLINCYSKESPNSTGVYELPLNLTNNPLNDPISQFTLSELSDHVQTMIERDPNFVGSFPGVSNLSSLPNITEYGTRLVALQNPVSFSQMFITDIEHSLINAIRSVANDYYQFKLNLLKFITESNGDIDPAQVVDQAMLSITANKNSSFPYAITDMIGYGTNKVTRTYTVTDRRNVVYPLRSPFSMNDLSTRSVLIYLNNSQLLYEKDYVFGENDSNVVIIAPLAKNDILTIVDYVDTTGSYIPPTPSKLGIYPKYEPYMYLDTSYASDPLWVIQGHDGSLTRAYTTVANAAVNNFDFRDLALLEFEKRVYNNIKTSYNPELINVDTLLPSVFRTNPYTYNQIYNLIESDFIKWSSTFGINYTKHSTFDINNHKTYNYSQAQDTLFDSVVPGNWRGIYKYYFDTDRPNTHPWEMLGFTVQPSWWEDEYGPAPYTSGNLNLWQDLEEGRIRQGSRTGVDPVYARPGLSSIIPVDDSGNVIDVREWGVLGQNGYINGIDEPWKFGDIGPAENAWRRSSLWPFAVQLIVALSQPAGYASKMFDPFRLRKDATGQYRYGNNSIFLDPSTIVLNGDTDSSGQTLLSSGYSVFVLENGKKRNTNYLTNLKEDLADINFNLMYKAGGFLSKDKLDIIIDSVSPNTVAPGVLLPNEDYDLFFNVSNPVASLAISGIIVEKRNAKFVIKGYDKQDPFFLVKLPLHRNNDTAITVGGKSVPVLIWRENTFYQAGQYVKYENQIYTVAQSINSGSSFNVFDYIRVSRLPAVGGATVLVTKEYSQTLSTIPYGSEYSTIQEVYDVIVGYGEYLKSQGFLFNEYNSDLESVMDWKFSGKEFLYWTTQNWANGSVITLSPFSQKLQLQYKDAVVDNVLDSFYDYSLLNATGTPFPSKNFDITREENFCTIAVNNTAEGLFFARLRLIQKEHAIIMANETIFGDVVYDLETGYRQLRMKLAGFKTGNWDGSFLSPGFVFDEAVITNWQRYTDYRVADIVKYSGKYYSANENVPGTEDFDFSKWTVLGKAPVAQLLPNFEYKINQFEDFYSLDIDNFDINQQKAAQHLTGYTPRIYLTNIIVDPIAQYKFYQGFIKEKGTLNSIQKLAKASINNLNGEIVYDEEWAVRVGAYGNFTSYNEIELPLREGDFVENSQIIKFVPVLPEQEEFIISYVTPSDLSIVPASYNSSSTFKTINSSTYTDNNFILPVAGYVRTDDISATAYNVGSLLDIANNTAINDGDLIWLGFRDDGQWDVYRYTKQLPKIINCEILTPAVSLTFTTDLFHNLSVNDIISVSGLDNDGNGVYKIVGVPDLNQFTVETTLSDIVPNTIEGLLFKFLSVRVNNYDDINLLQQNQDFVNGDKIFADSGDGTSNWSKWKVYQKVNNYNTSTLIGSGAIYTNQQFGYSIATADNADRIFVGSPNYVASSGRQGRVFSYNFVNQVATPLSNFAMLTTSTIATSSTQYGYSIAYDKEFDFTVVGAPGVNAIEFVKLDRNTGAISYLSTLTTITLGTSTTKFGSTIFVSKTQHQPGEKLVLVGAPQSPANIIHYRLGITATNTVTSATIEFSSIIPSIGTSTYDYGIVGISDGTRIAISNRSASATTGSGVVIIYNYVNTSTSYNLIQTISTPSETFFGQSIAMSDDGTYLFVSSPDVTNENFGPGKVYTYKWTGVQYQLNQTIHNPSRDINLKFGTDVKINSSNNKLFVSLSGLKEFKQPFSDSTTFDGNATTFSDFINNSGSVYVFERRKDLFVYANDLFDSNTLNIIGGTLNNNGSGYGNSLALNGSTVFVGAPLTPTSTALANGLIHQYSQLTADGCWSTLREQSDTIDVDKIQRAITINVKSERLIDYLDIIDPVKGRIAGQANQELRYKTLFDPAIYSIGTQDVVVDTRSSWIEDHVGELWWDLSTVKYLWCEQGNEEYRKNAWGRMFPGSSVDVYEWVMSEYLPSQWSSLADTAEGLVQGISGQPKYTDNSAISVKQYFNPATGASTNIYFYWVKNKVTLPDAKDRKIPANVVSSLIFDPTSSGLKYVSVLSPDSLAVTNMKPSLIGDEIYLNISKDNIDNKVNRHTEWVLLGDGNPADQPTSMLNKKLIDSLVGKDSLGNPVPDPSLSNRQKYGIQIRPRQSMFVDRTAALRNAIEYTNRIMRQYLITDIVDFTALNSQREIPDAYSREWDQIVDTYEDLQSLVTVGIQQAQISAIISTSTGKITSFTVINSGTQYGALVPDLQTLDSNGNPTRWEGPTVTVVNDTTNAYIELTVNELGNILPATTASIVNGGRGFIVAPTLTVRPHTVIVRTDENSNGRWAKYELQTNKWVKVFTQDYNTPEYWEYVNWIAADYDALRPLVATVEEPYQLAQLDLNVGDYVKVNNQGNGRFIILQKVTSNGTWDNDFNLLVNERGTIQFKESLWNTVNNPYNFDYFFTYDQTLYDQTPEVELIIILNSIKDDIFVGPLKEYWNRFFFTAVKYAMSEQLFLDWAFKTSFINVRNLAGELIERPVYKFANSGYYEDYIKEVKPYHTKIRNYQVNYSINEPSNTFVTDFDNPVYYDKDTDEFTVVTLDNPVSETYPWKAWTDNYTLSVQSIVIADAGSGYTSRPTVQIIAAAGDTGAGATAEAYISLGKVTRIVVTNPGSGYKLTPSVVIVGGGSTSLVTAKAYPVMGNNLVNRKTTQIKFDRIWPVREIANKSVTDTFVGNNENKRFTLTWAAENKKSDIEIAVDGLRVLATDYSLENYREVVNGYEKLYTDIVLETAPTTSSNLVITYNKNIDLYQAVDRIEDYYQPGLGMPGKDLAQLLLGIEYPGAQIQGLPFDYTSNWDMKPYATEFYGDLALNYTTAVVASVAATGTTTLVLSTVTGFTVGPETRINTVALSTTVANINYFASDIVSVVAINTLTNTVTFSTATTATVSTSVMIEFWNYNLTSTIIDTVLEGGQFTGTSLIGALGISPEDVIVDGETFISPNISHAPEELVKGEIHESIGISVFDKVGNGSALISQTYRWIQQTTTSTPITLLTIPDDIASIFVVYNNQPKNYGVDYTIDFDSGVLTLNTQSQTGVLGIVTLDNGSINQYVSTSTATFNAASMSVYIGEGYSDSEVYAYVNGYPISDNKYTYSNGIISVNTTTGLTLSPYNFTGSGYNNLRVWAFDNTGTSVYKVTEEVFRTDGVTADYTLLTSLSSYQNPNAQAIVEIGTQVLIPPNTVYYMTNGVDVLYAIDSGDYRPPGSYSSNKLAVYVNGLLKQVGIDYVLQSSLNSIQFVAGILSSGDAISITNWQFSDYYFNLSNNKLVTQIPISENQILKVLLFSNQPGSIIRTETFDARSNRRYPLQTPILNDDYLWVSVDRQPLVNGIDYYVDDDRMTIIIRETYPVNEGDVVAIMSLTDVTVDYDIGYRMFRDILNRTSFKRLAYENYTQLAVPLLVNSNSITVYNGGVLPTPNPATKTPGVILIAGERIEYMSKVGNVLSQLKRATLGTGAKAKYPARTRVIDQSSRQNLRYQEWIHIPYVITATNTLTYTVSNLYLDNAVPGKDQFDVYYGGVKLRKAGVYKQNKSIAYDNAVNPENIALSTSTTTLLTTSTVIDLAVLVTATNQVWVNQQGNLDGAVNGFTYSGLDYFEPQFTVAVITGTTATFTLNLPNTGIDSVDILNSGTLYTATTVASVSAPDLPGGITATVSVVITGGIVTDVAVTSYGSGYLTAPTISMSSETTGTQAQFSVNLSDPTKKYPPGLPILGTRIVVAQRIAQNITDLFYNGDTTITLTSSTSQIADFLRAGPSIIPDRYYYGNYEEVIDVAGFLLDELGNILYDENGDPIEAEQYGI